MYSYNSPPAFQSRGVSAKESYSQRSSMSRPSAKSIYKQRKDYSESLNREPDNFQHRVEHLLTCDMDGKDVNSLGDCVAKLKQLDTRGKVWGQDMLLEVMGSSLQLSDIQTKEALESVPLSSILQTKAVLDSCAYTSILTVTVQERSRRTQVFMFQCEEEGAEEIKSDLDRAVQYRGENAAEPHRDLQYSIRSNLENIIGLKKPGSFRNAGSPPMQRTAPPPDHLPSQWDSYQEYEDAGPPIPMFAPREEPLYSTEVYEAQPEQPAQFISSTERNVEIFNHVLNDVEFFIEKVSAVLPQEDQSKKKKKKKKKNKNPDKNAIPFPPMDEYAQCLQKIKYGFNLLGKMNGEINNPSAPDYVHILFSSLGFLVSQYPPEVPPSVLSPLLTEQALGLLGGLVTPEEDQLWTSLGDSWNIPRSKWPDGQQIQAYIPEFYDGWQAPVPGPSPTPNRLDSRNSSQRFPPRNEFQQLPQLQDQRSWSPPPTRWTEPPLHMRVIYDFMARNHQELTVMKGELVQVVDKSKQWWKVRNSREEEGHVPQNVLEHVDGEEPKSANTPPPLSMQSRPGDVKAWLQYKGFSKITVQSLSVLSGALLLGMTRDEMRTVCPEEGGRVFFQLQAIKSSLALASEAGYNQYSGR